MDGCGDDADASGTRLAGYNGNNRTCSRRGGFQATRGHREARPETLRPAVVRQAGGVRGAAQTLLRVSLRVVLFFGARGAAMEGAQARLPRNHGRRGGGRCAGLTFSVAMPPWSMPPRGRALRKIDVACLHPTNCFVTHQSSCCPAPSPSIRPPPAAAPAPPPPSPPPSRFTPSGGGIRGRSLAIDGEKNAPPGKTARTSAGVASTRRLDGKKKKSGEKKLKLKIKTKECGVC